MARAKLIIAGEYKDPAVVAQIAGAGRTKCLTDGEDSKGPAAVVSAVDTDKISVVA